MIDIGAAGLIEAMLEEAINDIVEQAHELVTLRGQFRRSGQMGRFMSGQFATEAGISAARWRNLAREATESRLSDEERDALACPF